jgi:hypothetical protein
MKKSRSIYVSKSKQSLSNLRRRQQRELERQEKKGLKSSNEIQQSS